MTERRFVQVDVFGAGAMSGNPLAVVLDGAGLNTEEMQRFTDWTNLSEATFLLPPNDPAADYRVRIFCPGREIPFAGHPTLGSCHAWLRSGGVPRRSDLVIQECGVGVVPIRVDADRLAFGAPPLIRSGPIDPALLAQRLDALGVAPERLLDSAWIDNGPGWMGVLLDSVDDVLAVQTPSGSHPGFDVGLAAISPRGAECAIEVRALFADASGIVREDPVTGSLNASMAQWLLGSGRLTAPYVAAQGRCVGRTGRVFVDDDGDDIWIGGATTVVVDGTVAF